MVKNNNNDIIKKALLLETAQRTQFLQQLEDGELKQKIEFLLKDDEELTGFAIETSAAAATISTQHIEDMQTGDKIKQFVIVKLIAKGGMGSVYLAYDEKLKRNVAIKTIRSEYINNEVTKQRFKQEAQILSQINHPSICQIYDYINYQDGDLLVLEWVDGVTLNEKELSKHDKLEVFMQIASALVVAHDKNVIHRDLKPDNIMCLPDNKIKILDFGIAKSKMAKESHINVSGDVEYSENLTKVGSMMGTLLYMSPEQAEGKEVTKASDIYSFGIIMQEILTGVSFYQYNNTEDLKTQVIQANNCNIELIPKPFQPLISAVTQQEPSDRPSARQVAVMLQDISDQPKRRLKKIIITMLILFVVLGFSKYTYDLNIQKNQAEKARMLAENAREESEKVTQFLESLFQSSDPYQNSGEIITARQMLDDGVKRIDQELKNQPKVLYKLKLVIAEIYRKLGMFDESQKQLKDLDTLFTKQKISDDMQIDLIRTQAELEVNLSHFNKARKLFTQALSLVQSKNYKGKHKVSDIQYDLAVVLYKMGKYDDSSKIYSDILKYHQQNQINEPVKLAELYNSLGMINWSLDKLNLAEKQMTKGLEKLDSLTNTHVNPRAFEIKLSILNNLMNVTGDVGKFAQAFKYGEKLLATQKQLFGEKHPDIALTYDNLAIVHCRAKEYKECQELNAIALQIYSDTVGKIHQDYVYALANRAAITRLNGDNETAIKTLQEVLTILGGLYDHDTVDQAIYLTNLGKLYFYTDQYKKAIKTLHRASEIYVNLSAPLTRKMIACFTLLAESYQQLGESEKALQTYNKLRLLLEENNNNPEKLLEIKQKINAIKNFSNNK